MEEKFINIFSGLKRDYGYADINSAYKDPATGKLKLKYGWAAKELVQSDYLDHLNGKKSIGIQPCNEEGETKFGLIDIDPANYENFDKKFKHKNKYYSLFAYSTKYHRHIAEIDQELFKRTKQKINYTFGMTSNDWISRNSNDTIFNTDISGSNERFYITVVIEDDWSTYLGGSSREIDSTP